MTKISNQYSLTNILTADLANSRLGINNVSPTVALDVTGAGKFSGALTYSLANNRFITNTSGATTGYIVNSLTNTGNSLYYGIENSTGTGIGWTGSPSAYSAFFGCTDARAIHFMTSSAVRATITSAGNVGIGTSSPNIVGFTGPVLTVNGSGNYQGFEVATGGVSRFVMISNGTLGILSTRQAGMDIVFEAGAASEKMRITSGGNIGIGETSPGQKLTISNGSNNVTSAQFFNYTGDQTATNFISRGARADTFYHIQAFTSTSTEVFRVEASGNVKNATGSYGAISDIKLKENITEATPKLEDLLKVKVCNYNFKGNETKQIGVIAQELEKIFPSMVEESEDRDDNGVFLGTTTKSVKYSIFVPMLIKAVQELSAKVSLLENK